MALLEQAMLTLALAGVAVWLLARLTARRWPQGAVLGAGAIIVGVIALTVFFGGSGGLFGLLCAGGLVGGALVLYGVLWLMERWARSGDD